MKKIINTNAAPSPIGPYSQAVIAGQLFFASGQIAIDPTTGNLNLSSIQEETHQVMENIQALLNAANLQFSDVVKTTIFLKDMNHFSDVNEVYGSYFADNFPARETVQVSKLPKDVNVEISVTAYINS